MRLFELAKQDYYVRFGELPAGGRSKPSRSANWIRAQYRTSEFEAGISVYDATWDGKRWRIGPMDASLDGLTHQAYEGTRRIYLVTGERIKEDTGNDVTGEDGEPLLRNAKVIKELTLYDINTDSGFDYATEMDEEERAEYNVVLQRLGLTAK